MVVAIILTLVLVALLARAKYFSSEGPGALQIVSNPRSVVFLDGVREEEMTPYLNKSVSAGEHLVKIVPEENGEGLVDWEAKVTIVPNILTSINRDLASSEASSAGEILSLEKIASKNDSHLAVVSIPNEAVVRVDGTPKGFAPVLLDDMVPGDHEIVVSSPGYKERTIMGTTLAGYKLTIEVQLAQEMVNMQDDSLQDEEDREATEGAENDSDENDEKDQDELEEDDSGEDEEDSSDEQGVDIDRPYVEINETPTGWLRVRESPSTVSEELAKVEPGDKFPYLEEENNGWYKIEYEEGEEGWVSGVYVELFK